MLTFIFVVLAVSNFAAVVSTVLTVSNDTLGNIYQRLLDPEERKQFLRTALGLYLAMFGTYAAISFIGGLPIVLLLK